MEQGLSSNCDRVMRVGVTNIGIVRNFLGICVQNREATPKIDEWASVSILYPYCELKDSRMKTGGMEEIAYQSLLSNFIDVISTSTPRASAYALPSTSNFSPLVQQGVSKNVLMNAQSFLLTHPRGVSPV